MYSDELLDKLIAETPRGLDAGATAIVNMLRGQLCDRIRNRKAELRAAADVASAAHKAPSILNLQRR